MTRLMLVSLVLLAGVACSGGTSTPGAPPSAAASARPAAEQAYAAVLDKDWQPYSDAYAKPPCSKWDASGLPLELAACRQGSVDLVRMTQTFLDDLGKVSAPPRLAAQDGYLKDALHKTSTSLGVAIKALDEKNGTQFDAAAQDISDSFNAARAAYRELVKP
jgi:hypothetical protein